jgi:D,D-heptose 1,7-bisphosphate phosphatase
MRDHPELPKTKHKKAIFMDRDGTINVDTHYPHKVQDLILIPEAIEGVNLLSKLSFDLIIISNQSGIGLHYYAREEMTLFNQELMRQLEASQARIDGIYYCPHLESDQNNETSMKCTCSKPLPGLILEAAREFEIDLANSFMIGDKTSDILAGQRAGCKTILVKTGKAGQEPGAVDVTPDYIANHLREAAEIIIRLNSKEEKC